MSRSCATTTAEPSWSALPSPDDPAAPCAETADRATTPAGPSGEPALQLERWAYPQEVAERVAGLLLEQRLGRPERPLGLATGRTMEPVYQALARRVLALPAAQAQRLRCEWISFNLDEYVGLGPEQPQSFAAEMAARLIQPLGLDPARVQLPDGRAPDPQAEARRYGEAVAAAGGIGLQLLGLGMNGHLGFNEPPCAAEAASRALILQASTRQQNAAAFGGAAAAVPERAITLGLREILAADELLLVVTGAAKASILARVLQEGPSAALPASWIRHHRRVRVVADEAALGG